MKCPKCDATEGIMYTYPCDYRCAGCGHTWVHDDPVNHPSHYTWLPKGIEVIDIVELFNFNRGNALKYIMRAGRKGGADELEDLQKARFYLDREIVNIEAQRAEPVQHAKITGHAYREGEGKRCHYMHAKGVRCGQTEARHLTTERNPSHAFMPAGESGRCLYFVMTAQGRVDCDRRADEHIAAPPT